MRPSQDRRLEIPATGTTSATPTYCPSALSSWPSHRHHPDDANESRLPCREPRFTTLPAPARSAANFYLGHTPRLLRLKYTGDQPVRRGTNPGGKSPSCVSHRLRRTNHVAIPSYWEGSSRHARRFRAAIVSRSHGCGFQGTERGSIPLPVREKSFAAWQRLSSDSPASPRGPFMVELFIAAAFFGSHRAGQPGLACRQARTPHAGQVERSRRRLLNPLDGITRYPNWA